jgi:hypothetical protein
MLRKQSNAASNGQTLNERGVNSAVVPAGDLIEQMVEQRSEDCKAIFRPAR